VNLTGSMHGKSRRILIQLGDLISIKRDVLLNGCEYRDIRRDSRVGSVIGRILKGLRRRKMCVHLPQPIGNEDENDDRHDLVDGSLSQFWRFRGFVGFWRFRRHRHFAGDTISKLAWVDSFMQDLRRSYGFGDRAGSEETTRYAAADDTSLCAANHGY
jgi:hypothetical protein